MRFHVLDTNMPYDWFDFLGDRVTIDESDVLIVTDDYLDNYPKNHPNKVALLIEPPMRKPYAYNNAFKNYNDFRYIFTYDINLLNSLPNAKNCYFGGCAIPLEKWDISKKQKLVSIIVSAKKDLPGTLLRHEVIESFNEMIDQFGYMNPICGNFTGLNEYMFNICIENSKHDCYFSEKICDCFALGTVPIYWGTKLVKDLFNPEGIITFETLDDLYEILKSLNEDLYKFKMNAVKENFEIAKSIGLYDKNIIKAFEVLK